ncbi:aminocarboxymuconate-semialdehyde decarboxylase [Paxillus involutus ATCC 200175]|nr:aminocarboxymuconate-semialdehyde decarboxylase [Paxillus involutus ATCC 200175]
MHQCCINGFASTPRSLNVQQTSLSFNLQKATIAGMAQRQHIIDVHHHIFLDARKKFEKNTQVGWITPPESLPWRPSSSIAAMDAMGIQTTILSPPPFASTAPSAENRAEVRDINIYASRLCAEYPGRFGLFAGLPCLDDVQGAVDEITFAMDHLAADGFALISSYGVGNTARYIADDLYDPVWDELNRRHAVVFLHGAQTPSSTPYPHPFLGLPISEVPNETYKAAAHLVVTGKKRRFHNVRIILAHLGGSTPFLAPRVAVLSHHMGCPLSPEEILQDFQSFYYETALSSHPITLAALEAFVPADHILFGSDYPAVSTTMSGWYTKHLEEYYASNPLRLDCILRNNALSLFPRLQKPEVRAVRASSH